MDVTPRCHPLLHSIDVNLGCWRLLLLLLKELLLMKRHLR
jgi:hypothetical protein